MPSKSTTHILPEGINQAVVAGGGCSGEWGVRMDTCPLTNLQTSYPVMVTDDRDTPYNMKGIKGRPPLNSLLA